MFNDDGKWTKQVQTCLKKCLRVQSLIFDVYRMLNDLNKFKHLFKEMFEGSKFDNWMFNEDVKWSKQVQYICFKKCLKVQSLILDV